MPFHQQERNHVVFHTADAFTDAGGVAHGFSTRLGGVSTSPCESLNLGRSRQDTEEAVLENYRRFCRALGTDVTRLVTTHQVHGDTVRVASSRDILPALFDPMPYDADALITNEPGLCLTIYYADCIPVLLYDPENRAIGAVHSGWRGTALGIVPKAVDLMTKHYGTDPANLLAAIGPGIGACCFETHDDVPKAMQESWGDDSTPCCIPLENGKFSVDLKGLLRMQLLRSGVSEKHLEILPLCTACHPELYWSHRKLGGQRGNQAAMLQLLPSC